MESVKRRRADAIWKGMGSFVVTRKVLAEVPLAHLLVVGINRQPGPEVAWDHVRGCYGLRARQPYRKGQAITEYGGRRSRTELQGDYVAKASAELYIDGQYDFKLCEKGRWINESDRDRTVVNVILGRTVRAACAIVAGEWLFADYGPDFVRDY